MDNCIARTIFTGRLPGKEPFKIVVEIGTPYQKGTDPEEWWCPVSLEPLYRNLHDAIGGDSLQALCMGTSLVLDLLAGFKEQGGSIQFENGDGEVPLEVYAFGAAKKPA